MAINKNSKTYQEFKQEYDKYQRKLNRMKQKDENVTIEDFGFEKAPVNINKMSYKKLRQATEELKEFNSRKYFMKKVGITTSFGETKNVYMPNIQYQFAVKRINEINERRIKYRNAVAQLGKSEYRLNRDGTLSKYNYTKEEIKRNFENIDDFKTTAYQIKGGALIGSKHGAARKQTISPVTFKNEFAKRYKGMKGERYMTINEMNKRLMDNYIIGVKKNISVQMGEEIEKIFKQNHVSPADFVGLFYMSGVFDFEFTYSKADVDTKIEKIKTELENLKKNKQYKQFKALMNEKE